MSVLTLDPRSRRWWAMAAAALVVAGGLCAVVEVRPGHGLALGLGVAAGALIVFSALLGLRKRWLRLRVGSVASWTSAHNALGTLIVGLSLLHCGFEADGLVPTSLLVILLSTLATGLFGMTMQVILPRLLAARLVGLSPTADTDLAIVQAWRRVHDRVVEMSGPADSISGALAAAEREIGLEPPSPPAVSSAPANAQALARFYTEVGFPFLQGTERARSSLARDASSRLVFDGLRAHVSPQHHAKLDEVEAACREVRLRVEERRLRQLLFGWQVLHIPLGMAALVLLAAHVAVVLYY